MHPDTLTAFVAGLRGGTLPEGITAQHKDEAARRFGVYRNTVSVGLTEALAQRFPVIRRLVGAEFFGALAQIYQADYPPTSPVLFEWGQTFPNFLASVPPLTAYPYMADVARIELARGQAYHAADADPITPQQIADAADDPAQSRLSLHPSVQVLHLSHPGVTIWAANQPGAATKPLSHHHAEIALVLRDRNLQIPVIAIGPGDAAMVQSMAQGRTLLAAAQIGAMAQHGHDPQPILVHLMQAGAFVNKRKDIP